MEYTEFTRRTNDPKLRWLEKQLRADGIKCRRNGHTFHAPILEVDAAKVNKAWAILSPVDDIPDDDPQFRPTRRAADVCPKCAGKGVRTPRKFCYQCKYCGGTGKRR